MITVPSNLIIVTKSPGSFTDLHHAPADWRVLIMVRSEIQSEKQRDRITRESPEGR